jgi:hypothetical protein
MGPRHAELLEAIRHLRNRAVRYRRISTLLGGDEGAGRLRMLADSLERRTKELEDEIEAQATGTRVLLAEISSLLARSTDAVWGSRLTADDALELSHLCTEEARAATNPSTSRALAARAIDLAQFAEKIRADTALPLTHCQAAGALPT